MRVCTELLNLADANLAQLTWWIFFTDFFACCVGDKYSHRLYATALFLLSIIQTHYQTVSSQYPDRHLCSLPHNFQQYHLAYPTSLSPVYLSSVVLQTQNQFKKCLILHETTTVKALNWGHQAPCFQPYFLSLCVMGDPPSESMRVNALTSKWKSPSSLVAERNKGISLED